MLLSAVTGEWWQPAIAAELVPHDRYLIPLAPLNIATP
jgi:hypothetical protein